MTAQGRCGRFVGAGLVAGPLLVAAVVLAGPAQADEAAFLNHLHKAGIHAVTGGDAALLQVGWNLCQQLSEGASPQQLEQLALQRSDAHQGSGGVTPQQAVAIVDYALVDLCPSA